MNHTTITDAGLEKLAGLNQLSLLFIEGTQVTDAGIAHLKGLKSCGQIAVGHTAITDAGIKTAQKARPKPSYVRMNY